MPFTPSSRRNKSQKSKVSPSDKQFRQNKQDILEEEVQRQRPDFLAYFKRSDYTSTEFLGQLSIEKDTGKTFLCAECGLMLW